MGRPSAIMIAGTELALVWARKVARASSPDETLSVTMEALRSVLGMRVCATNRLVAADDEYEVCLVSGHGVIPIGELLGSRYSQHAFESLISGRYERTPAIHVIPPDAPEWAEFAGPEVIPDSAPGPDSIDPWHPGQELFVALRDRAGEVLAILSLDAPIDGEIPPGEKLVLASLVAQHAATTLEARIAEDDSAQAHREAEALAGIVRSLEAGLSEEELVQRAVEGIRSVCGYHTVCVHLIASEPPALVSWVSSRPESVPRARPWTAELDADLLIPDRRISRSFLLSYDELERHDWPLARYVLEGGRGRRGWHRKALVIPIDLPSGRRLGVVLADNPIDRLLPTTKRVRQLEAFATQIALMIEGVRSLDRARVQAQIDPLTQLANRARLYFDIDRALRDGEEVAVLFIDLDGFKEINDTFGHSVGDELLCHVARRLEGVVRPGSLVSRLAGDEFVVVSFGSEAVWMPSVLGRALATLREPFSLSAGSIELEASAGIAQSGAESTVEQLIHDADLEMYRAKSTTGDARRPTRR
jgi:diguanylate cyclase (GGDEF)-like protein